MKSSNVKRVTVTLPSDLVRDIDRQEKNRSKFIAEAVRCELDRRQRAELRRSLANPHPETAEFGDLGFAEWARGLTDEDAESLVNLSLGTAVRWIPGKGWTEPGRKACR